MLHLRAFAERTYYADQSASTARRSEHSNDIRIWELKMTSAPFTPIARIYEHRLMLAAPGCHGQLHLDSLLRCFGEGLHSKSAPSNIGHEKLCTCPHHKWASTSRKNLFPPLC